MPIPTTTDRLASLELLRTIAQQETDWHVNADGHCAICGTSFLCERAVLAEMVLGSF
jgi:hypothetical protein